MMGPMMAMFHGNYVDCEPINNRLVDIGALYSRARAIVVELQAEPPLEKPYRQLLGFALQELVLDPFRNDVTLLAESQSSSDEQSFLLALSKDHEARLRFVVKTFGPTFNEAGCGPVIDRICGSSVASYQPGIQRTVRALICRLEGLAVQHGLLFFRRRVVAPGFFVGTTTGAVMESLVSSQWPRESYEIVTEIGYLLRILDDQQAAGEACSLSSGEIEQCLAADEGDGDEDESKRVWSWQQFTDEFCVALRRRLSDRLWAACRDDQQVSSCFQFCRQTLLVGNPGVFTEFARRSLSVMAQEPVSADALHQVNGIYKDCCNGGRGGGSAATTTFTRVNFVAPDSVTADVYSSWALMRPVPVPTDGSQSFAFPWPSHFVIGGRNIIERYQSCFMLLFGCARALVALNRLWMQTTRSSDQGDHHGQISPEASLPLPSPPPPPSNQVRICIARRRRLVDALQAYFQESIDRLFDQMLMQCSDFASACLSHSRFVDAVHQALFLGNTACTTALHRFFRACCNNEFPLANGSRDDCVEQVIVALVGTQDRHRSPLQFSDFVNNF